MPIIASRTTALFRRADIRNGSLFGSGYGYRPSFGGALFQRGDGPCAMVVIAVGCVEWSGILGGARIALCSVGTGGLFLRSTLLGAGLNRSCL